MAGGPARMPAGTLVGEAAGMRIGSADEGSPARARLGSLAACVPVEPNLPNQVGALSDRSRF